MRNLMFLVLFMVPSLGNACPDQKERNQIEQGLLDGSADALTRFRKQPECMHWLSFYPAAQQLFTAGEKEDALFYFYVGQLRGRVAAAFDPDASRTPALLSSLNEGLGGTLNEWAGRDLRLWIAIIDRALEFDAKHPLTADSEALFGDKIEIDPMRWRKEYATIREGLVEMRRQLAATDPEDFRRKRQANGLTN